MSAAQAFPAGNLPKEAFLTTIGGRRCTAVPRPPPATSAEAPAVASVATAPPAGPPAAGTTSIGAIVAAESVDANTVPAEASPLGLLPAATSTTSLPLDSTITANTISGPGLEADEVPRVQAAAESPVLSPAALAATAPPAASPSAPSPLPTLSIITSALPREPAASSESSQTNSSETAPAASDIGTNNEPAAAFPDQGEPSPAPSQNPGFPDVAPVPTNGGGPVPEATSTSTIGNSAVSMIPSTNGGSVQSTVAVAGGVIGGVVALSIAAFLIWWWRRRVIKKRRSTLLTPLDAADYRDKKGSYEINRGSIGPTPISEKFRATVGYNVKKIRGRLFSRSSGAPSVNMDRGTSQFIEVNNHSRATSSATSTRDQVTAKDRLTDWWSRVRYNWKSEKRLSKDTLSIGGGNLNAPPSTRAFSEKQQQPDFLTLLNMDDGELDREAQRRRASLSRPPNHLLDLSFGGGADDPFSDAHALAHHSAKPAPLVVSASNNPFSDANAVRDANQPNTYVADIRRSRGQSVTATTTAANRGPAYTPRSSGGSVDSFAERRNKFRSDPFDLEPQRPTRAAAGSSFVSSTAGTAGSDRASSVGVTLGPNGEIIRRPAGAHRRGDSFTSKYSSGISMGDYWSDPGPDVGPAASREALPLPEEVEKQQQRGREGRVSGGSAGSGRSVGKAM